MLRAGSDEDTNADAIQMTAFGHEHVRKRVACLLIKCRATFTAVARHVCLRVLPDPIGMFVPSAAWLFSDTV